MFRPPRRDITVLTAYSAFNVFAISMDLGTVTTTTDPVVWAVGMVRDPAVHARVCAEVAAWIESHGWRALPILTSPITGPEGNVEFLLAAERGGAVPSP